MVKRQVMITYPQELLSEPIIYNLGQQFNVVIDIHRADISEDRGWAIVELEGEEKDIDEAITWATSRGIRVEPVSEDMSEG